MHDTLRDLYGHQAWADAEHWRAAMAAPQVTGDTAWFERQHHIHLVQRVFLRLARGEDIAPTKPGDFTVPSLRIDAMRYHRQIEEFLGSVSDARLDEVVELPWAKDSPQHDAPITIGQALLQAVMHSQHHRGQNAARMRELGGEPPITDLIIWFLKDKPKPSWT